MASINNTKIFDIPMPGNNNYHLKLTITENDYNIDTNRSSGVWYLDLYYVSAPSIPAWNEIDSTASVQLNGSTLFNGRVNFDFRGYESPQRLTWGSFSDIQHEDNGSKIMGVIANFYSNVGMGTGSINDTMTLYTIPRASTISASTGYIGSINTLTIDRKSSAFTHSIAYSFGSLSGYIKANGSTQSSEVKITAESIPFTIPTAWYAQIPNAQEGNCTLTIKTYNGNTQVGSSQTFTFKAKVDPSSCSPTLTASVIDSNSTTTAITGDNTYIIKGKSTAKVTYSAAARNSATLSKVLVNNTQSSSSPFSFTLNSSSFDVKAIDSRGLSTIKTLKSTTDFKFIDYNVPIVNILSYNRVSATSNNIKIKFNGTYYNGNFKNTANTLTIVWKYRERGTSSWTTGGTLTLNTHYKVSGNSFWSGTGSSAAEITLSNVFTYTKNWEVGIFATDRLDTISNVVIITKGTPIFNWGSDFFNVNGTFKINGTSFPVNHASSDTTYGIGTTSNYGHCKIRNNLTQGSYVDGVALSSYQGKVLKGLIDTLTPVTLYDDSTGKQTGSYITIPNITTYKKLQITFTSYYGSNNSNTGGTSNIFWLDLTRNHDNLCRGGMAVPYYSGSLTSIATNQLYGNPFNAIFEANLSNGRLYCMFGYNTEVQTNNFYVMTKVVGYKY